MTPRVLDPNVWRHIIDLDNLKNDILNWDLKTKPEKELPKLCKQYDTILQTILNKHAPLLTKTVSERPPTPWMTQEILKAKVWRRSLERVWRRTRYRHDRSRYRVQCNLCNGIMEKAKANFYANIILENSEDPKKLWKSINNIFHRFPAPSLPKFFSIIFSCSPKILENLVQFCCLLAKLDHLACNKFSKLQLSSTLLPWNKNPINAKWSNFQNTQQNCTKFSGMLGEYEKIIREKRC